MTTYEVGQTITFGLRVTDANGAPANVGVTPTCTVSRPDGTTTVASVSNPAVGSYVASVPSTLPGRWLAQWTGSGANSGGMPYSDSADVWPAEPRMIISLADARAALNLPSAAVVNDDELRLYIAAATDVIESIVGPVLPTSRTYEIVADRRSVSVLLPAYPESVTEVREDGVTLPATAYRLRPGGVLSRTYGTWGDVVEVVADIGWTSIPPSVILAAREQVRFLWQVGQNGQRPAVGTTSGGAGYVAAMPQGFAVPRRVIELLGDSIAANKPVSIS